MNNLDNVDTSKTNNEIHLANTKMNIAETPKITVAAAKVTNRHENTNKNDLVSNNSQMSQKQICLSPIRRHNTYQKTMEAPIRLDSNVI